MEILYSDILPLTIEGNQKTIIECFNRQAEASDKIEIAVGYISRASLDELEKIVDNLHIKQISLIIGMYFIEGMPENSYHAALRLNKKWIEKGIGEIRLVRSFKYHGKLYCFSKNNKPFAVILGSANMGFLKSDASNKRQYEIASLSVDERECYELNVFINKLKHPCCSANISEIKDMVLIRERNVSLDGVDTVTQVTPADVKLYFQHRTDVSFVLPIKAPSYAERFLDDGKHFTKSNINVCYAAPRNQSRNGKSRDWYEVQMTVSTYITQLYGYPKRNTPFFVVTDDGYWFKAHTTSDHNKQFNAVGNESIMGRWIKGRLAAAGLVTPVNDSQLDKERKGMITSEMLNAYGSNAIVFTKTDQKALDDAGNLLEVWTLSFEAIVG